MPENISKDNTSELHSTLGQYFLQKKIAQGGMSEIYKGIASDIHGMKRTVVIKKILPHIAANKEFVDMLVSEAKIAVQLNHGNIAQIYDLGKAGQDYFMVMEFVDGKSLSQINKRCLKEGSLIPLEYVCYFISETANGLDYMHKKTDEAGKPLGIVHRDISPQNIIVSYSGTVKIIDFGIAKAAFKIDATESGILKGKFAYMSPEHARGEEIDGRSDIFSLGIILHELTSGRRLFKDKDNRATIRNVRRAEVQPPSTYNSEIPKEIDAIVMKALTKDLDKRYQKAGQMRDDLLKFLYSRFRNFKPALVVEFISELFAGQLTENEDEKENTPLLIIDQTQSAIQPGAPQVMKEFMLEEEPPPEPIKPFEPFKPIKQFKQFKLFERIKRLKAFEPFKLFKRLKPFIIIFACAAVISGVVYAGSKFGWWHKWSKFLETVEITPRLTKKPVEQKFMTLIISSNPAGASVFIDDIQTKHQTPVTISDFKADGKSHTIGIFLENYNYFTLPFTAVPDETIRFSPNLQMAYGELSVISHPEGANVLLNGEITGQTPFKKEKVEPGTIFKVAVAIDGYTPFSEDIRVAPNKAVTLRVSLIRLPKKPGESPIPIPKIPETAVKPSEPEETLKASFSLTEIPLLPAQPAAPPQKLEQPVEQLETIPETQLPLLAPSQPGAPIPDTRDKKMELDYNQ